MPGSAQIVAFVSPRPETLSAMGSFVKYARTSAGESLVQMMSMSPTVGYIRTPTSLGYDLYYARDNPAPDGGRRIVLATNRRVSFREASNNTRSMQYQFTLIEIHLDKNGKGEGKLVPAAKVSWDRAAMRIEVENYNALPVDLTTVTTVKR